VEAVNPKGRPKVTWKEIVKNLQFIKQGCARGLFSRDRDLEARDRGIDNSSRSETETKAFRARDRDEAEAYQL